MQRPLAAWIVAAVSVGLTPASTPAEAIEVAADAVLFTPPACNSSPFTDVPISHPMCPWIRQLYQDGISSGCAAGRYCPSAPLTRAQAAMILERAMRGTAAWDPWRGLFQRTIIVSPVAGDPEASGQRLLTLLAGVTGATTQFPVRLWLEPGVYDLGNAELQMKQNVVVQGASHESVQILTSTSGWAALGAPGAGMRSLYFENNGPYPGVHGVDLSAGGTLEDVIVVANGGDTAIAVRTTSDLSDVAATAFASDSATGIEVVGGAPTLNRVVGTAVGAEHQRGIHVTDTALDVLIENSAARAVRAGFQGFAIFVTQATGASVTLRDVTSEAMALVGDAPLLAGIYVTGGRVRVENSRLEAGASQNAGFGLSCVGAAPNTRIDVRNSRLIGPDATVKASDADCTVRIAGSQLQGGAVDDGTGTGDVRCVASYGDGFNSPGINECF